MTSAKPLQWMGIGLGACLALYFTYTHLQYFGNAYFLGEIVLLEVIIACLWKFEQRFFVLLVLSFIFAGMNVPLQSSWNAGRWVVLAAGAVFGFVMWTKAPGKSSTALDLIAFFCVCSAFVSAGVSAFVSMASLKALSLMLLFLYCVSGARLAAIGREKHFFRGLVRGCEILVYVTAVYYLGLHNSVWGNPNSLGAVMSVGTFPILLWGWFTSDRHGEKLRLLLALLICTYLVFFSMARAAMIAQATVTIVFCVCLRQYKLLVKLAALCLLLVALAGMLFPDALDHSVEQFKDTLLYKGHKEEGLLSSRRSPWERSMASIKARPFFGSGYGTSPTGEDPGLRFGRYTSSAETARENGNSYINIIEWVGLLGVLPFFMLLGVTVRNMWRVFAWMRRTANPGHYSIPLAMVVLAGLVHANFEDWLFAVGYYLCVYFWALAFLLGDLAPSAAAVPAVRLASRTTLPVPGNVRPALPTT
jgi:O-antigen ligase